MLQTHTHTHTHTHTEGSVVGLNEMIDLVCPEIFRVKGTYTDNSTSLKPGAEILHQPITNPL
jgi:hypothetical protein